jgi:hypothetical protein
MLGQISLPVVEFAHYQQVRSEIGPNYSAFIDRSKQGIEIRNRAYHNHFTRISHTPLICDPGWVMPFLMLEKAGEVPLVKRLVLEAFLADKVQLSDRADGIRQKIIDDGNLGLLNWAKRYGSFSPDEVDAVYFTLLQAYALLDFQLQFDSTKRGLK